MKKSDKNRLRDYAKYSSVALQMATVIFLGVYGGLKLDQWFDCKPVFTIVLSLFSVGAALYLCLKDL